MTEKCAIFFFTNLPVAVLSMKEGIYKRFIEFIIFMKYILSIIFILLFTGRSYAGTGDFSPGQDNAPDKPVVLDSSGRRLENSPDIESFSETNTEFLEEKSPDKISEIDRRMNISDEIKNQDFSNYNTYNVTPDMPGYWDTRGDSFFSDKRYTEAIECYIKALKINPSSKELDDKIAEAKILFDNLDVYFKNSEGTTLLHSRVNNFSDVKALVYNGADINAANIYGDTPLHYLAGYCDYNPDRLDTARFLIEHGASVNLQDREGNTPLHKAAENGFYSLADLLIKKGAIIDMRNFYGYTPLDLAILWGREDTVRLLQKYGAK
ncbi:MAG: ankyrin repeat domain-containing protein [Candidatus Eremiobacterota bacterium]